MNDDLSRASQSLRDRLLRETRAEVHFDRGYRGLYSTDASLYQVEPLGVVIPRSTEDVAKVVEITAEAGIPILPRGAATSLSGQTVGSAVVIDDSKYLNRIGIVDRDAMTVRAEPGVVLDQLNAHLKPLGLMFGPDVSTSDRATLGGMIGNNSAGARSLRYGKMVDHVKSLDVVLADGTRATLGPISPERLSRLCDQSDSLGRIYRGVRDVVASRHDEIIKRFPHILRRVSGYNLDEFVPGLPVRPDGWIEDPWAFNLARLIVGSEGTLAVVTSAELKVMPIPPAQGLVVLSFATIPAALDRLAEIVDTGPVAVEMLDRMILELAAANPLYSRYLNFTDGLPAAVLAAQFYSDSQEDLDARMNELASRFEGRAGVTGIRIRHTDAAKDDFWKVRKAGFSLLTGMVGDAKPIAFVEDTAVDPSRLPEFYARFEEIVSRHNLKAACYGHADVGCLHIRPIINVKTEAGVESVRSIARQVSELVIEFGGAMSGEHGDGLARSIWNEDLFGREIFTAFQEVKRTFDPENRLNPDKVVGKPDPGDSLRIGPHYRPRVPDDTVLDFSTQGGFAGAVEMCTGVGACRKTSSGTMCPSYMATREEMHSTRGRANALRLVMDGTLPVSEGRGNGWGNQTLMEALDLCLQCKACKSECPSKVDLAKLKSEVLYQFHGKGVRPLSDLAMAHIGRLYPIASALWPLSNALIRNPVVKRFLETVVGIDRRRTLPLFAPRPFHRWFSEHLPALSGPERGTVVLLDDCFTNYNDPDVGVAAVRVLESAGYRVRLAGLECCGRPAFSKGILNRARALARENVRRLLPFAAEGMPILGLEPSCVSSFADEYRDLRLGPDADIVISKVAMLDQWIASPENIPELRLRPSDDHALVHGHCHQKALFGTGGMRDALRRIPGLTLTELDSGCCGMAGSFGYERGHYDVSVTLANRVLIPAAAADPRAKLIAPGFSCRSQFHGLTNLRAFHPVQLISEHLAQGPPAV